MNRSLIGLLLLSTLTGSGCLTFGGRTTYVQPESPEVISRLDAMESRLANIERRQQPSLTEIPQEQSVLGAQEMVPVPHEGLSAP